MVDTAQFGLPLLMPGQAQKHVTVNEALSKLDAFVQFRITSFARATPPSAPQPGKSYFVAEGSSGAWAGHAGTIATYVNGGWVFTQPLLGWRAWDEEGETYRVYDGTSWLGTALTIKPSGSAAIFVTDEFDHVVAPGASNLTSYLLPSNVVVFGVTGRVTVGMQGVGLTKWRLGVSGSEDRYGANLGIALNSYILGVTAFPLAYYAPVPLLISAEEGGLSSGTIRLAIHYMHLSVPRPV